MPRIATMTSLMLFQERLETRERLVVAILLAGAFGFLERVAVDLRVGAVNHKA